MAPTGPPYVTSIVLTNQTSKGEDPGARISPYRRVPWACMSDADKSRGGALFRGARAPATPAHRWLWGRACATLQMERRLESLGRLLLGDRLQFLTYPRPSDQWSGLALGDPHGSAFGIAPNRARHRLSSIRPGEAPEPLADRRCQRS
jgi:hypothetical protein